MFYNLLQASLLTGEGILPIYQPCNTYLPGRLNTDRWFRQIISVIIWAGEMVKR